MTLEAVQSRIADIQARLGVLRPVAPASGARPAASPPPTSADAAGFSAQLDSALRAAGAAPAAGSTTGTGTAGEQVVATARKYLGVPYVWGGTTPKGFDCSGLVQHVFAEQGIRLPRTSGEQARAGRAVTPAEAQPGDLVAFDNSSARKGVDHIGIYLGDGTWIAAPRTGDVVKIQSVDLSRAVTIRRVLPDSPVAAARTGAPAAARAAAAVPAASAASPAWAAQLPPAARQHVPALVAAGAATGVDPRLLASVAWTESGFNAGARSAAGAVGLMQLMPATARGLGVDPSDPAQAARGAATYLSQQLQTSHGRVDLALAAYNAGPGAVRTYGGIPPYAETRAYVAKVIDRYTSLGGTA